MLRPLPRLRFRFTDPDDCAKYGDDWTEYDETTLIRLPTGRQIQFEKATGISLKRMAILLRDDFSEAVLAATWIARTMAGVEQAFEDYEPLVQLIEWSPMPEEEADADPLDGGSSTSAETSG